MLPIQALPLPITYFLKGCFNIHRTMKGTRRVLNITENPLNIFLSLLGHGLHYVALNSRFIRIPAKAFLIAKRVIECVETQKDVTKSYEKLCMSFTKKASVLKFELEQEEKDFFLTKNFKKVGRKVEQISIFFFQFIFNCIKLSHCYINLIEAFHGDTDDEAVQDFFLNSAFFVNKLKTYEKEIHATFYSLGVRYEFVPLNQAIIKGLLGLQMMTKFFDEVSNQFMYLCKYFNTEKTSSTYHNLKKPYITLKELYDKHAINS